MWTIKGWKTLMWNGAAAGVVGVLTYFVGVDWSQHVDPSLAVIIVALVNAALRIWGTSTKVGSSV
jgi:hypothetical protein